MNIFEIDEKIQSVTDRMAILMVDLESTDNPDEQDSILGEIQEAESELDELCSTEASKVDAYHAVCRMAEGRASVIGEEIARLSKMKRSSENLSKRLKDRMKEYIESKGEKSLQGKFHKANVQNNPLSVNVEDDSAIPDEFIKEPPAPPTRLELVDKKALAKAHKEGQIFEGVEYTRGTHLRWY